MPNCIVPPCRAAATANRFRGATDRSRQFPISLTQFSRLVRRDRGEGCNAAHWSAPRRRERVPPEFSTTPKPKAAKRRPPSRQRCHAACCLYCLFQTGVTHGATDAPQRAKLLYLACNSAKLKLVRTGIIPICNIGTAYIFKNFFPKQAVLPNQCRRSGRCDAACSAGHFSHAPGAIRTLSDLWTVWDRCTIDHCEPSPAVSLQADLVAAVAHDTDNACLFMAEPTGRSRHQH